MTQKEDRDHRDGPLNILPDVDLLTNVQYSGLSIPKLTGTVGNDRNLSPERKQEVGP